MADSAKFERVTERAPRLPSPNLLPARAKGSGYGAPSRPLEGSGLVAEFRSRNQACAVSP
jgi:hypothetical protein